MRRVSEKSTPSEVVLLKNEGVRFLETLAEVVLIRNRGSIGHCFSEADVQEAVKLCQDRMFSSSLATAPDTLVPNILLAEFAVVAVVAVVADPALVA